VSSVSQIPPGGRPLSPSEYARLVEEMTELVDSSHLFKTLDAWDHLDVGGVVINDVPSYRVDNMPYGGVKDSGLGREGPRYAMEEMSELRLLVLNP